jgi:predicted component of type VI protein secretion system
MVKLVFIDKNFAGRVYELVLEKTTVGRAPNNTLIIDDKSVSTHHCEILVNGREVIIRELGSTNGTHVSGAKVHGQMPVQSGQIVRFGSVETRIEMDPSTYSDTGTDITAVYGHSKFERQAIKERMAPLPAGMSEPPAVGGSTEDTLVIPKTASAPRKPAPPPADQPPLPPLGGNSKAKVWLGIGVAAVVILAAILYLVFGR